jgi:outer membrane protein OmpA-like peptidoglycan-associated protein
MIHTSRRTKSSRWLFAALLLILGQPLWAQKLATLKSDGERAFQDGRWAEAYDLLSQYQAQKPGDLSVLSHMGRAAYYLHQPDQAIKYLEYATLQAKTTDYDTWYVYARTLHGLQDWERAIEAYKQFLRLAPESYPYRTNVHDNLRRCVSGMLSTTGADVALIENPGPPLNSAGDEFAPLPSPNHNDRLYFASASPYSTGGRRNDEGFEDLAAGHWCSDMYVSRRSAAGWGEPVSFSPLQNTARFEYAADFTDRGRVLCFFRGFTLYGGQILTDTAGINDERRSNATPFNSPMRPEEGDVAPFIFLDETLIFASRRAGGYGGLDLWTTRWQDTSWTEPLNLGAGVNSEYDETTPFLARDGRTLYFSSNRLSSVGGLDVFFAVFDPAVRVWTQPASMGLGVNSPGDDAYFRIASDGMTATFASNRITDNLGELDLYIAYFREAQTEQTGPEAAAFVFYDRKISEEEDDAVQTIVLEPLFYNTDRDLAGADQQKMLQQLSVAMRQHPDARLIITCHTDDHAPAQFDLFAGIKRAEQISKSLTDRYGVSADRVVARSAGQSYPLARNVMDGVSNPDGQRLNRRVDFQLLTHPLQSSQQTRNFNVKIIRPEMALNMQAAGTARLDEQDKGLIYRVEFASTKQVINSDALALFTDVLIEAPTAGGTYRYMAGAERQYAKTTTIRRDLQAQGFKDANVIAYIDGVRIERGEAVGLLKKYPDLAAYMKG